MNDLLLAKTFYDSASRFNATDRARVFDFITKYHENPAHPSIGLERITEARDPNLWSARVTHGLRAVLHKEGGRSVLLYAGQHDDAYEWAARRRVSAHPVTGALQIVETVEGVERMLGAAPSKPPSALLFTAAKHEDAYLLSLGVPEDWLPTVRRISNEDELLIVATKLPEEVAERLLALAVGEFVTPPKPTPPATIAQNVDTLRRFFIVQSDADLADVLNQPLEAWIRFLHPSQRAMVEQSFSGPAKVTGSAGTGKTVVALHRARSLARKGKHVLLTSFVRHLCRNLERNLRVLCRPEELARIQVSTVHQQAFLIARTARPGIRAVGDDEVKRLLAKSQERSRVDAELSFLRSEWAHVVDAQGLTSWEEYRDADRRGRGRALTVREREKLWQVFGGVCTDLDLANRTTWAGLCRMAAEQIEKGRVPSPFDAVVVDEVQDLQPSAVRLLAELGGKGRDGLLLVGDAGQRIYPGGFSLRSLGIDVRGRSRVLRINYRTTEEIQRLADRLLGPVGDDLDDGTESRRTTVSLLRGPEPVLAGFATEAEERANLVATAQRLIESGLAASEIAVFARTRKLAEALVEVLRSAGIAAQFLGEEDQEPAEVAEPGVTVGTMHGAKGLEFKSVIVAACDDRRLPNAFMLQEIADPAERDAAIAQERRLLYVSLTRARDEAYITWSGTPSPFVQELLATRRSAA